ncbi:hybrid sensor histidine kinase/response regulator transcription factor [Flavicella marina]|uniref:hybrid sensor histidine kinase/response regulator transcription factor n=1 Tax=Flavicella marina TaxID=1475951 RepID=UPI0012658189|nr:ATP-binding protein [Flavicella marina]
MRQKFSTVCLLTFLIVFCGFAQNSYDFEKLDAENGISQSIIYNLQQDKTGNIWMATEEGVVKYNSVFSDSYTRRKGLPKEVGNRVNTLFIDSEDRIWLGIDKGICLYDAQFDTFKYIVANSAKKPLGVRSICEDINGKIWIGAYNGLWSYEPESTEFVNKTEQSKDKVSIQTLFSSINETLLLGTSNGLYVYEIQKEVLRKVTEKPLNILSIIRNKSDYLLGTKGSGLFKIDNRFNQLNKVQNIQANHPIRVISKDVSGEFLVGTDGAGVFALNSDYQLVKHYSHDEDRVNSLSSDGVYDIIVDRQGILWVATYGGGVNYIDKSKAIFKKIKHEPNELNSIKNSFTRSIEEDIYGRLWFGTKKGVSILNPKTNNWIHIENLNDIVLTIESDGKTMWLGTFNNGVFKIHVDTLKISSVDLELRKVYVIYKDSEENMWIGGIEGDLIKLDKNGEVVSFPIRDVRSVLEFKKSIIIAGRVGVTVIKEDKIVNQNIIKKISDDLSLATINAIVPHSKNEVLIATNGGGLLIYNNDKKSFHRLAREAGMPSDIIQGVISYKDNEIWASTTKGLARIRTFEKDTVVHVFDKNDGLSSTEFNYGSYKEVHGGLLAFGGIDGVTIFDPSKIKRKEASLPNIVFDEFSVFNKVIAPTDSILKGHINTVKQIDLKYRQNSITLKYLGVSNMGASKIKYSWKLDGFSEEWSAPETNRQVNFTNLSFGDYIFRVKASNGFGEWGLERNIRIKVKRPWWATTTAYFIYFFLVIVIFVVTIYFTQFIVSKRNADEQIEFFNNLTHEIRTPLTILLSSLDSVSDNTEQEANNQVKKTITRLNALFEQMLNFRKSTSVNPIKNVAKIPLEKHIKELVLNFKPLLEEYNIELKINNKWKKDIFYFDKETLNKIVFNLISNAVKYSKKGGSIDVLVKPTGTKQLLIQVKDTGIGIPKDQQKFILKRFYRARNVVNSQKPGTGLGLMMVKNLVEKLNGSISFDSEENVGTTFKVVIPNLENLYQDSAVLPESFQKEFTINEQTDIEEFSDRTILIVEDNNELRSLLAKSLGTYFQVHEASNGKEGLELAGQVFPDIILTDLIMPEMDGMQMAKELLNDINLNHIPVFMMTVLNNSELKIESIESGISEYIEKPLDINLLLAKITNTLSWQNKLRKKYVHQSEKDTATQYRNSKDESFITNLESILLTNISDTTFSVHELCDRVGMSRTSLYMKLKNLIDLSPQDFIIHTKLKYGKSLLIRGGMSVKEIAYQSGFSNPKYFSTSFKKFYGESPTSFLSRLKDEDS